MALDKPPLLMRRRELLAKLEATTTGTPETLSSSDGVFVIYNPQFRRVLPPTQRPASDSAENLPSVRGASYGELTFETDLVGPDAGSGNPGWATTFLPACNMEATGTTWKPVTIPTAGGDMKTLTLGFNEAGRRATLSGACGDLVLPLNAGQIARARFRFLGLLNADADTALTSPNVPTATPPRWAQNTANGITWALNSTATGAGTLNPRVSTAEIRLQNNVIMRPDANSDAGYRSALVVSRDPVCVIDPEAVLVATFDWWTAHKTSIQAALTAVIGQTAGNKITVTFPKASIRERPGGNRDGIITEGGLILQANRNGNTRDSDMTLAFS